MGNLEFGNVEQIQELKDQEQNASIEACLEALNDALYICENLTPEHTALMSLLEGTITDNLATACEDLQEAFDKIKGVLQEFRDVDIH